MRLTEVKVFPVNDDEKLKAGIRAGNRERP